MRIWKRPGDHQLTITSRRGAMTDEAFDDLAKAFGAGPTRRDSLKLLLIGMASAGLGAGLVESTRSKAAASPVRPANQFETVQIITGSCNITVSTDPSCQAVTSPNELRACPNLQQGFPGDFNGCGGGTPATHSNGHFAGGVDVTSCCNGHDCCYSTCGADKVQCDTDFLNCMLGLCAAGHHPRICAAEARTFYDIVSSRVGESHYVEGQVAACVCCCPDQQMRCNGKCVDTQTDPDNCGKCGNVCPAGEQCVAGECTCGGIACPAGGTCCNKQCVDTQTDAANCGSCGHACVTGDFCVGGTCLSCLGVTCGAGETCCNGQCVNTQTDPNNCGNCGFKCAVGANCAAGTCVGNCGANIYCDPTKELTCCGPDTASPGCCSSGYNCLICSGVANCGASGTACCGTGIYDPSVSTCCPDFSVCASYEYCCPGGCSILPCSS